MISSPGLSAPDVTLSGIVVEKALRASNIFHFEKLTHILLYALDIDNPPPPTHTHKLS
jgi:hypothetical protein